ncbi:MAG: adenylate/guanylate cyclase domain-containing protein [Crocinitomicaceae bacterium]
MLFKQLLIITLLLFTGFSFGQSADQLYREASEYQKEGRKNKAIRTYEIALSKAEAQKNIDLQMNCHLALAELKDNVIKYKEALAHYQSFSALYKSQMIEEKRVLTDSVSTLETEVETSSDELDQKSKSIDSLTTEQLESQLNIQGLEIDNQTHKLEIQRAANRRNILFLVLAMVLLASFFVGWGYFRKRRLNSTLRNKNYQIAKEKEKSDVLLLNILPKRVADELKEYGRAMPASFKSATVMFTDFKGFTKFSEQHSPEEIVSIIDHYFSAFDKIMEKYGIEKIKTIGDAYMCVAGIPEEDPQHVQNMIKAAIEMHQFVLEVAEKYKKEGKSYLEMRVGIHTGSLVAGIVGSRKFSYDVWGDAVNIAARMEQSGEVGQINVSETVYEAAKTDFEFEFRGEVEAKNKGVMKMYFVTPSTYIRDFEQEEE